MAGQRNRLSLHLGSNPLPSTTRPHKKRNSSTPKAKRDLSSRHLQHHEGHRATGQHRRNCFGLGSWDVDTFTNPINVDTWHGRSSPSGWALPPGLQTQPIDVDQNPGTHFFPINVISGSLEFPIMAENDTLALAIPVPATPALPLFLAKSDKPDIDA